MADLTATELEDLRGGIESQQNSARDAIEKQYIADRTALEEQYHKDLADNREAKRQALLAAGLNSDGSDPQGRSQG